MTLPWWAESLGHLPAIIKLRPHPQPMWDFFAGKLLQKLPGKRLALQIVELIPQDS
jgi:hypothetical protein